jgi:RNA polymerase-binding transcription factor DksA
MLRQTNNAQKHDMPRSSWNTTMDKANLQRYERLLRDQRRKLLAVPGLVPAAGWEGDLIDQANAAVEAELQIRLHETDAQLQDAIEEALARVKEGRYSVCAYCNQPIPKVRLEAIPWTRLCRSCAEAHSET